jgi:uncharacterized membrane protein YbhN (UPF0104 family)
MSARTRRAARWLVGIGLLVILLAVLDVGQIGARLASVHLGLALPAIAGLVGVHLIAVASWRRLGANLADVDLEWPNAIRLYYAGLAVGTVTPGNIGSDVYRVTALGNRAAFGRLTRVVVIQRLTSLGAVVSLGVLGALALPIDGLGPFALLVGAFGVALAIAVVVLSSTAGRFGSLGAAVLRRLGLDDAGSFGGRMRSAVVDGFGFGLVFHVASVLLGYVLVGAVDPALASQQPVVVLAALAVARLSLAIPISPNGIGVQEGLLGVLFLQAGLSPETAIAASLLNRLALLGAAALGAVSLAASPHPGPAIAADG